MATKSVIVYVSAPAATDTHPTDSTAKQMEKCCPRSSWMGVQRMTNSLCVFLLWVRFRGPLTRMSYILQTSTFQIGTFQIDWLQTNCCLYFVAKDLTVPNLLLLSLWTPTLCQLLPWRLRRHEVSGRPAGEGTPLPGMTEQVGRLKGKIMLQSECEILLTIVLIVILNCGTQPEGSKLMKLVFGFSYTHSSSF